MRTAALIPSYGRPDYLRQALRSLRAQSTPPEWLIVIARPTDRATWTAAADIAAEPGPGTVRVVPVHQPGYLPPIDAGRRAIPPEAEIVLVTDDDAAAAPDALERLVSHYRDAEVGAVCGRLIEHRDGRRLPTHRVDRVGAVGWSGRFIGHFEMDTPSDRCRDVEFMRGAWMSFRRSVFDRLEIRTHLNRDVGVHYEVDLGLQTRRMGYRILFDPLSRVDHFNAPRLEGSARDSSAPNRLRAMAHNVTLLQLIHLRGMRRAAALAYNVLVGDIDNWALIRMVADPLLHRRLIWRGQAQASYRGKLDGLLTYLSERAQSARIA